MDEEENSDTVLQFPLLAYSMDSFNAVLLCRKEVISNAYNI